MIYLLSFLTSYLVIHTIIFTYFQVAEDSGPIFYPSPNVSRSANQLSEDEQVKIAQRIGLIQHLPTGTYDGSKKNTE